MGPWIRLGTFLGDICYNERERPKPQKIKTTNDIETNSQ